MLEDDDEILPPKPEEIPKRLAEKWEREERADPRVKRCPHCGKNILVSAAVCAYCGKSLLQSGRFWLIVAALLLIALYAAARIL